MADWPVLDGEWFSDRPYDHCPFGLNAYIPEKQLLYTPQAQQYASPPSPTLTLLLSPSLHLSPTPTAPAFSDYDAPKRTNPREIRNQAEKQRRDKLSRSISELAAMVPPVVAANRKVDKTSVLRLTAHYLRAYQYVFGDSIGKSSQEINSRTAQALLGLLKGFLLTTTYKGLVVVASQNVQNYLGYSELDLLGQNILNITHPDDHKMLKEQLMPKSDMLGPNGELLYPDKPDGKQKIGEALASEKRRFIVRFKKLCQRSEPNQYVSCYVEGTLRKSDRACRGYNRCCQMVRRARARGDNPCSSGNDVVFIGVVRPTSESFRNESFMESYKMEYRTRHSVDGEIIQCEQRISLVTGYMTHEVNGVNAMNFMHRDDVRWVIIALREMYDQQRVFGESCYRLMTKNGQFIYMRTRGQLDVDEESRAVRSFVCTNTVVAEPEGQYLIKLMKKKFMLMVNNNEEIPEDDIREVTEDQAVPIEHPRQLEKVILHLVTNLPSPQPSIRCSVSPDRSESPSAHLAIIPPRKERIVSAIEKIYNVITSFKTQPMDMEPLSLYEDLSPVDHPPTEQPPTEEPPTKQPPTEQSPTKQQPSDENSRANQPLSEQEPSEEQFRADLPRPDEQSSAENRGTDQPPENQAPAVPSPIDKLLSELMPATSTSEPPTSHGEETCYNPCNSYPIVNSEFLLSKPVAATAILASNLTLAALLIGTTSSTPSQPIEAMQSTSSNPDDPDRAHAEKRPHDSGDTDSVAAKKPFSNESENVEPPAMPPQDPYDADTTIDTIVIDDTSGDRKYEEEKKAVPEAKREAEEK